MTEIVMSKEKLWSAFRKPGELFLMVILNSIFYFDEHVHISKVFLILQILNSQSKFLFIRFFVLLCFVF